MYVLGLADGLYLRADAYSDTVGILSEEEAHNARKIIPGSFIEPYNPFEIYPTDFEEVR